MFSFSCMPQVLECRAKAQITIIRISWFEVGLERQTGSEEQGGRAQIRPGRAMGESRDFPDLSPHLHSEEAGLLLPGSLRLSLSVSSSVQGSGPLPLDVTSQVGRWGHQHPAQGPRGWRANAHLCKLPEPLTPAHPPMWPPSSGS